MGKKRSIADIPAERIEQSIQFVRGQKVLLDADLAQLYGVETKALVQGMKRNIERFPDDFMFQLTREEWAALRRQIGTLDAAGQSDAADLRSHIVTLKSGQSNRSQIVTGSQKHRDPRYPPYAFSEQGVAMLSSVLRSKRAVQVNIEIMRAFVRLRGVLAVNVELARRLDEVEKHLSRHDEQFVEVIRAIRRLMEPAAVPPRRRIGFHAVDAPRDSMPGGAAKTKGRSIRTKRATRASRGDE